MSTRIVTETYDKDLRSYRTEAEKTAQKAPSVATYQRYRSVRAVPLGSNINILEAYITGIIYGTGAYGTNCSHCTVNGTEVRSNGNVDTRFTVPIQIDSTRLVLITLKYQFNRYTTATQFTVKFKKVGVVVVYEELDEGYTDNEILVPVKKVMIYEPFATDFSKNGVVLHPTSCIVEEEAAGSWELTMDHPFDPEGRWQQLLEEYIIKAPVPPYKIPATTIPVGKVYKVKSTVARTAFYSQLPTYTKSENPADNTSNIPAWDSAARYLKGDLVTHNGYIHQATAASIGENPSTTTGYWALVAAVNPTSSSQSSSTQIYNPGVIIKDLVANEQVTFIATYSSKYDKVRDSLGRVGYAIKANLEETATSPTPFVEPERTIYTQLFRIYAVSCEETAGTIRVSARHISYDYEANGVYDCKMTEAEPATAIALLQGRLMNNDTRLIACPMNYPLITADWSFGNPIQALLDPDEGLAAQLHAKVFRDNADFFILPENPSRVGAKLKYGVNLRGVTWERSSDEIVTRIIPRAGDGNKGFIYLDEVFVDSDHINEFSVIHVEVLDSEYSVGQKIEHADGTTETLTRASVLTRMKQEALDRYVYDGADSVTISLDVDFVLLGDTEEYKQYRNLQRINLYDKIEIDTGSTTLTAQVIGYEWDCLAARYNGLSIGKVYSQARKRIPGYRVARGAITYSKLSPGLIKWVKGAN